MTNNSFIFSEQQKNAFYEHDFENLTPSELDKMICKYKPPKNQEKFPTPESIFHKEFRFLPDTLEELQIKTQKKRKLSKEEMTPIKTAKLNSKNTKNIEIRNIDIKVSTVNSNIDAKTERKQRTKLGVLLE